MALALYTHIDMLDHRPSDRHVESPARLLAVTKALQEDINLRPQARAVSPVSGEDLRLVHADTYLRSIAEVAPTEGRVSLDEDTQM
ncbi:MAG TPA: histone deacetylase family protein, partial [Caulobacteraceae bacterium]